MAKGRNKHNRVKHDSTDQQSLRGHGGRGRGRRGRGGQKQPSRVLGSSYLEEELDVTIQMYADSPNPHEPSGYSTPRGGGRGRGRGRGRGYTPRGHPPNWGGNGGESFSHSRNNDTPRGRGRGEFSGFSPKRGRGLGASAESTPSKLGANPTLSDLLFTSRPFLRPVNFVRSTQTPFLFTCDEDILQSITEEVGDDAASHVPTADRVERIFHGANNPFGDSSSSSSSEGEEEIEEIDFNDMDRLLFSSKQEGASTKHKVKVDSVVHVVEGQINTSFYQKPTPPPQHEISTALPPSIPIHTTEPDVSSEKEQVTLIQDIPPSFVVNTQPSTLPTSLEFPRPQTPSEDEEIIVYVAPHPRVRTISRATNIASEDIADTSAFKPYSPPATLALASMSIQEDDSATGPPQTHNGEEEISPKATSPPPPTAAPLPIPTIENLKFAFPSHGSTSRSSTPGRKPPALMTARMAKKHSVWERKKVKRERRRQKGKHSHFAAFGALLSEARLHDDVLGNRDPKSAERRRGDSDVEWGTESGDDSSVRDEVDVFSVKNSDKAKGKEKEVEKAEDDGDHGMQVDEEMDIVAMKRFVGGLIGREAGRFTTMDDIEVENLIKDEDEERPGNNSGTNSDGEAEIDEGSDEEDDDDERLEEGLRLEENLLLGESSDDDESEDGDDFSPKSGFQARLETLRARSQHQRHVASHEDEEDEEDILQLNMAWAQEDDDYDGTEDHIQDLLEQHALKTKTRENAHSRAVQSIDFADIQPAKKRKNKGKDLPEELQAVWERDRQKKAERKRERELEKLVQATDALARKKGGKKGRKTMLAAAHLDPTINVIPNRIIDLTTLIQQIRRFVADIGGPGTMSLPPTSKETRKNVHELALAFGLKSQSKGKGNARYTTLSKTTRTSTYRADEWKIAKIVRRAGGAGARGDNFGESEGGRKAHRVPKHREGDEVGATAPKIGQGNLGFKMLSAMGWSEGNKIGLSGGLEAPLVAIIKHSKLGLGATRQ